MPSPKKQLLWTTVTVLLLALAGCSKPVPKTEDIRPVRVIKLSNGLNETVSEFSGEVRPRIESRLSFRVGGKVIARKVDIGATVKRGQVLMQLDPQDLQLAQAQTSAAVRAAESNRALAAAELQRYRDLREKNFVSQAVLDARDTAWKSAQATYEQAVAAARSQGNQTAYSTLLADADGVVTGIDAEVGQVVAAGTPVVRVAQLGEKEVVIGIPENSVDTLRKYTDVRVTTWANQQQVIAGRVREISPMADPATRTYTARIAIPQAPESVRLGMTAYVAFAATSTTAAIKVPLTALLRDKNATSVWVVENGAVRLVPVQVAGPAGNDIVLAGGVSPGQTIVVAGVNLLKPGQKVSILDDAISSAKAGAAR